MIFYLINLLICFNLWLWLIKDGCFKLSDVFELHRYQITVIEQFFRLIFHFWMIYVSENWFGLWWFFVWGGIALICLRNDLILILILEFELLVTLLTKSWWFVTETNLSYAFFSLLKLPHYTWFFNFFSKWPFRIKNEDVLRILRYHVVLQL